MKSFEFDQWEFKKWQSPIDVFTYVFIGKFPYG
jgi:hypothetical protein